MNQTPYLEILYGELQDLTIYKQQLTPEIILSITKPIFTDLEFPYYSQKQQLNKIQYEINQELQELYSKLEKLENEKQKQQINSEKTLDYSQIYKIMKEIHKTKTYITGLKNLTYSLKQEGEILL